MIEKKPVIIADPFPQALDTIFTAETWQQLTNIADVITSDQEHMDPTQFETHLPEAVAIIGQTAMPKERLDKAPNLRAIFNVEGNFYQNIDYDECFKRNIRVLNCGEVYARPVAEMALAMAIDLSRGITWEHIRFSKGTERYVLEGNRESRLLTGATVGLIGFGLLGKSLRPLLTPFNCKVKVYDPWLPESVIKAYNCLPTTLDEILSSCEFIFILAGVTNENKGFLGKREFDKVQKGAKVLLMSRAAVVDFEEFTDQIAKGNFKAATDVFPSEPFDKNHRLRTMDNCILSPHRAGGIPQAFHEIGAMILDDFSLLMRNLVPVRMQAAQVEIVSRLASKPVK
ncbi:MAG: hydroxyacid dehydrogenase [Sphaerochaetaceae bacterium]|nr:hydroxyacid dehydrogenase [Sphaerochaetaceae bacterium]MDY0370820.1 hydroxyacid dehydrogenase [Sphaerochaetaceae bacterium]